jgi:hypothetical protein
MPIVPKIVLNAIMHGLFMVIIKHNWPQNITEALDFHCVNIAAAKSP